jgi:hypothetical protein
MIDRIPFKELLIFLFLLIFCLPDRTLAQDFQWVDGVGSSGYHGESGTAIAADFNGDSYVTGLFFETVTFGGFPLTVQGGSDIFITKYDPDGNVLWATSAGSPTNSVLERGTDIVYYDDGVDGLLYVIGEYSAPRELT